MGAMYGMRGWPISGTCWGEYPYGGFGGLCPGNQMEQQQMNAFLWQNQGWGSGPWLEGMRQIEMWKCDHCGSRFHDMVEKCKNCGSTAILRFDDPGRGAMQQQQPLDMETARLLQMSALCIQQQSVSETVEEFREEVAAIMRRPSLWQRFLRWLDHLGFRERKGP
jgi:membrane protease subunit (stomatin/prohibitin family)